MRSSARPAPSRRAPPSPMPTSRCCPANMSASACTSGTQPDALMVPQTALGSSQLGKYVYVVGEGNKVDQRLVSLGPSDGGLVAVLKGVAEGDQVIVGNLQKIGPGAGMPQ